MARCSICDHLDGHANEYLHKPSSANKVRYYPKKREWICDECSIIIQSTTYNDEEDEDQILTVEETTNDYLK